MPNNKRNILILSFSLAVISLGFGIVMPIFPFYMEKMGASGSDYGLLIAIYAVMQLIFAPIWGSISDRVGRKPILALGIFGSALTLLLFGLSTSYWMLLAARTLSGILSSAALPTTLAYVSDCTTAKERGGGMGRLGGAAALGLILGPGAGGLLGTDSLTLPFFIAAALSMACLLLVVVFLPESLPAHRRSQEGAQRGLLRPMDLWRALRGPLGLLFFLAFLVTFGMTRLPDHLWPVCDGQVRVWNAAGRGNPDGGRTALGRRPGPADRSAHPALGRRARDPGRAAGQRGWVSAHAAGAQLPGRPVEHRLLRAVQNADPPRRYLAHLAARGGQPGRADGPDQCLSQPGQHRRAAVGRRRL
jgi:multidrug resistance protein